jgi:hypothetical protein
MSTVKIFGGSLNQYGNRLNLGLTGSESFINNSAEVEMPPVWENKHNPDNVISYNYSFPPSFLEADSTNKIYHPGVSPLFSANGIITTTNENIGHDFRLAANAFVSCSDGNTNETITLTLRSSSLLSGSNNIQEITPSDISVIFPNNSEGASNQPVAKFFIQTSSNFEIFEDHEFRFVVRAEDSTNRRAVQNHLAASSNQPPVDVEYKINIKNLGTAPFIITQSADVSISSSISTEDHISEMAFHLGNEGSPDFSLIKDIYIKDRDRTGEYNAGSYDINIIKLYGELPAPANEAYFNAGLGGYIVNTGSLPNVFQISSSDLNVSVTDKDRRYFKLRFNEDLLPNKLTAANSPYVFSVSASDAPNFSQGIAAKSSSCEITLTVDNLNPVWTQNQGGIFTTSQQEIGYRLSTQHYASASDPGGDNVELTFTLDPDTLGSTLVGDDFEFFSVNDNTPTASFYLRTSSQFPSYPSNPMSANALTELIVTATDDVTLAANNQSPGTANRTFQVKIDAPPAFNTNTLNITKTEDEAGLISNSDETYPNAADPYEGFIGGTCNLDTGSGFTITSDDSRVQASWFAFTGNDATAGNLATFNIVTSSLFRRVDADVTASLIVTASDARNQEATCSINIHITNEDDYPDIFPSFSNLQFLIAPGIDGETTLGNTVNFSSVNAFESTPYGINRTVKSIVNVDKVIRFNATHTDTINTFTSANGTTGLNIEAITTDGKRSQTPEYEAGALSSGPGTIIWWWKTQPNRRYTTISSISTSDVTQQPGGSTTNSYPNRVASINSVDGSYLEADITITNGTVTLFNNVESEGFFGVGDTLTFGGLPGSDIIVTLSSNTLTATTKSIFGNDDRFELLTSTATGNSLRFDMEDVDPSPNISNYFNTEGDDFHMLSVTFSDTVAGSTGKTYLNKTLKATDTATGGSTMNTVISNAGLIGGRGVSGSYASIHPVTMSMMAYYDTELNQEDITQIFNAFSASHGLS